MSKYEQIFYVMASLLFIVYLEYMEPVLLGIRANINGTQTPVSPAPKWPLIRSIWREEEMGRGAEGFRRIVKPDSILQESF